MLATQDACVVDDDVEVAELVECSLDHGGAALGSRYGVVVRNGDTAGAADLLHHLVGGRCAGSLTADRAPEIVLNNFSLVFRRHPAP